VASHPVLSLIPERLNKEIVSIDQG